MPRFCLYQNSRGAKRVDEFWYRPNLGINGTYKVAVRQPGGIAIAVHVRVQRWEEEFASYDRREIRAETTAVVRRRLLADLEKPFPFYDPVFGQRDKARRAPRTELHRASCLKGVLAPHLVTVPDHRVAATKGAVRKLDGNATTIAISDKRPLLNEIISDH